jgi:tRNA A37 threonylcarbamoyltransferase TsaD
MKKQLVTVKDFTTLQSKIANAKKQIKNELTEDAAELRRSLLELLDELDNTQVEIDETELASRVREMIDAYNREDSNEVPAAVANAIAAKFKALQDSMPKSDKMTPAIKNQVAAAILRSKGREAIIDAVADRTSRALKRHDYRSLIVGGGVSLNGALREALGKVADKAGVKLLMAKPKYCGDNAAMIAGLACYRQNMAGIEAEKVDVHPSLEAGEA